MTRNTLLWDAALESAMASIKKALYYIKTKERKLIRVNNDLFFFHCINVQGKEIFSLRDIMNFEYETQFHIWNLNVLL